LSFPVFFKNYCIKKKFSSEINILTSSRIAGPAIKACTCPALLIAKLTTPPPPQKKNVACIILFEKHCSFTEFLSAVVNVHQNFHRFLKNTLVKWLFLAKIPGKLVVPTLAWHAGAPTGAAVQAAIDHTQQCGRPTVLGVSHHQRSAAVTVARILPT
jgi:hypothetical protein